MIASGFALNIEASPVGDRGASQRDESVTPKDFGTITLLSMGDDAQNLHGDAHACIDPRGITASIDALGEGPYVAVDGVHDVIGIGPLLRGGGNRGGQPSQRHQQR